MGFWGNMVKNCRSDVQDDDIFDILRNCFDHNKAVALIEAAYTPAEIKEMGENRSRRCRLDLDDETIERRFYKKNEEAEILPWEFYGELATKDGDKTVKIGFGV